MARLKSNATRQAILDAAAALFAQHGYIGTTITAIARRAGTSPSGVYVYFASKIEIAFAVFDPWMRARMDDLARDVAAQPDSAAQLRMVVHGLLDGIAADRSGQTLTLVQALATARPGDGYSRDLLDWTEARLAEMLQTALPGAEAALLNTINRSLMLAFDGVALRQNLRDASESEEPARALVALVQALVPAPRT